MSELKSCGGTCHVPQTAGGQGAEGRVGSVELECRAWGACPGIEPLSAALQADSLLSEPPGKVSKGENKQHDLG